MCKYLIIISLIFHALHSIKTTVRKLTSTNPTGIDGDITRQIFIKKEWTHFQLNSVELRNNKFHTKIQMKFIDPSNINETELIVICQSVGADRIQRDAASFYGSFIKCKHHLENAHRNLDYFADNSALSYLPIQIWNETYNGTRLQLLGVAKTVKDDPNATEFENKMKVPDLSYAETMSRVQELALECRNKPYMAYFDKGSFKSRIIHERNNGCHSYALEQFMRLTESPRENYDRIECELLHMLIWNQDPERQRAIDSISYTWFDFSRALRMLRGENIGWSSDEDDDDW